MNAQTTVFVRALQKGPDDKPEREQRADGSSERVDFTHLYIIDNSKPDGDAEKIAKFTMSQLWSYGVRANKSVPFVLGCGFKAVPRQMFEKLKKSRSFFVGTANVRGPKLQDGDKPVMVEVLPADEFDQICNKYEELFEKSEDIKDYKKDPGRDVNNRQLGIDLFREILNSEERVKKLMVLMEGVMYGGVQAKSHVWPRYRVFFQFILSGMILDYKNRLEKRKEDPEAQLEFPHLSYTAFAQAINEAKVNLTVANTEDRRRNSVGARGDEKDNGSKYATLAHILKWYLVLGQSERSITADVYQKLGASEQQWRKWCAFNLGGFLPHFGLDIGTPAPEPAPKSASKKAPKPKPFRRASTFNRKVTMATTEKAKEEAVVDDSDSDDDDSDDDEEETPKPETPETPATEQDESDEDDGDDDEEEEEEKDDAEKENEEGEEEEDSDEEE